MRQTVELLAPAGSYEGLVQAIEAGADAVYCGGKLFGARAYAENFTEEELIRAIDYVHLRGKVLFLTVNTLVKEQEFRDQLYTYLKPLYEAGLDGVIVQDTGVIDFIHRVFPDMEVHTSTQLTVTSAEGVAFLKSLGAARVVLARELSLEEIRKICSTVDVEIECFVHGALCYCYSGQCLLSSMLGGRSGNRGRCAQPCRLPYRDENGRQAYYLSLRDLCTIEHIPEMIESGILSFKIEGRMKKPEYTAGVTAIYRKYIDLYYRLKKEGHPDSYKVDPKDLQILHELYSRTKSGSGYYFRRNSRKMLTLDKPSYASDGKAAQAVSIQDRNTGKLNLNGKLILKEGETGKLYLQYEAISVMAETEEVISRAQNQPLLEEQIRQRMNKTGNTPFQFAKLEIEMQDNLYCPVKVLNELRRSALEQMETCITGSEKRTADASLRDRYSADGATAIKSQNTATDAFACTALVRTEEQLMVVLAENGIHAIYLEPALWLAVASERLEQFRDRLHAENRRMYMAFPHILRQDGIRKLYQNRDRFLDADGILIRNTEGIQILRDLGYTGTIISDSNLYSFNAAAHAFWLRYVHTDTIPVELNRKEIRQRGTVGSEMIVYGYLPLMITAQCLQQTFDHCTKSHGHRILTDRYNKQFTALQECDFCSNLILNSLPLNLMDETDYFQEIGCRSVRLQFTTESRQQTEQVLNTCIRKTTLKGDFTRGHYKRGVE